MSKQFYKIKVFYETGDSFSSNNTETILEPEWEKLDVAKENLKRIKTHYKIYQRLDHHNYSWDKEKRFDEKKLPDYVIYDKKNNWLNLKLLLDNGNEMQIYVGWCGYFERLYGADIIIKEDEEMSFQI